jgi:alginate O-acetyltransferase complex protein AlgI
VAGRLIDQASGSCRKLFLILSLLANLGVLAFFKYSNFASNNLNSLLSFIHISYSLPLLNIILPIGLSFHTFQSMSYTIEVYKKRQKAEKNLLIYSLYVLFYPQLVAGPIERPQNLLHQFREKHELDFNKVASGIELMAWGFFKKLFVADRLALFVSKVFAIGATAQLDNFSLLIGVYFFSFQIYFDFSGYTDIARGAARVMGFELIENFKNPYGASTIQEFWQRWHISLSTWFRDYLYIPLGGSKVSLLHWMFITMIVFLVSGLWHGANSTFIFWGAVHGLFLIVSTLEKKTFHLFRFFSRSANLIISWALTFNAVTFAWIFFRAESASAAFRIISSFFTLNWHIRNLGQVVKADELIRTGILALCFFLAMFFLRKKVSHKSAEGVAVRAAIVKLDSVLVVQAVWCSVIAVLIIIGAPLNETSFIYFQF